LSGAQPDIKGIVMPIRVQRKRTKGWRMPPNTVSVTRPGRWGNPWKLGDNMNDHATKQFRKCETVADCVQAYRQNVDWDPPTFDKPWLIQGGTHDEPTTLEVSGGYSDEIHVMRRSIRKYLRGKNLACFCPLDQPCHADVLLEIANSE
jgi:hypothetical protein